MVTLVVLVMFGIGLILDIFIFNRKPKEVKKQEIYYHPDLEILPTMCDGGEIKKGDNDSKS